MLNNQQFVLQPSLTKQAWQTPKLSPLVMPVAQGASPSADESVSGPFSSS